MTQATPLARHGSGAEIKKAGWAAFIASLALGSSLAVAQGQAGAALGSKLTPLGADPSASADGVIPAWAKVEPQGQGWAYGQYRGDAFRHKGDKPLFSIDAGNVDKHAGKLSPGHVALVKATPGYRMDVYPTRRTCGIPDFVAENTRKNVGFAKLDASGEWLEEAHVPGIPFPMPSSGAEAMWNTKMRYRGVGFEQPANTAGVSPRKGGSDWIKFRADQFMYLPSGKQGSALFSSFGRVEGAGYFANSEPISMAGQALIAVSKAGVDGEAFYYFPGQRRVRRMPSYSYDAPQVGFENQYTIDESGVFAGELDRFDWKLVGKQELIVPYNTFGMYDFKAKFEDVAQRDFIAPSHRRYETHRVWVVEATVKKGTRHMAPKRLFYLDEDSWAPLMAVDYDAQGRVWKVREGQVIPVYETGACDVQAFVQHNLVDGRYMFDFTSLASGKDNRWLTDTGNHPRMKMDFYTADNLRAISER